MSMPSVKPIVILGAGLTGLTAAWKLAEKGFPVIVIEAEPQVGGLATTLNLGRGCRADLGPHRFHSQKDWIIQEIETLIGKRMELKARITRIYFNNKFYNFPLSPSDVFFGLSPLTSLKAFGGYLHASLKRRLMHQQDNSFESYVINRFGKTLYELFFGPYTQKVWGEPPVNLSADWAVHRIPLMNLWDTVVKTLRSALTLKIEDPHVHSPFLSLFYYPSEGIGVIAEKMKERVQRLSGKIYLGSQVTGLRIAGQRVVAVFFRDEDGKLIEVPCEKVVSTLPITSLIQYLQPRPSEKMVTAAKALKFRPTIYLYFILGKERVSEDHWIYFSGAEFPFSRASDVTNFSSALAPVGKTVLCLEITCRKGDEVWNATAEKLCQDSLAAISNIGLVLPEEVEDYCVARTLHSYPLYTLGYENHLNTLLNYVDSLDNLLTCGRQGLFRYINMDHAIEMGMAAANLFAGEITNKEEVYSIARRKAYYG